MTQITLNPNQIHQLQGADVLVECRDVGGQLVGYLHVAGQVNSDRIPDFSAERLAAFESEPGGRGLPEILADLRQQR